MRSRSAAQLAWFLWGIGTMLLVAGLVSTYTRPQSEDFAGIAFMVLAMIGFPAVGALIASRRPENPIGWLFLAASLILTLAVAGSEYATRALVERVDRLPGAVWAGWLSSWLWPVGIGLLAVVTPLLFPSGRPPSPRWHPVLWLAMGGIAVAAVGLAFFPGPLDGGFYPVDNPVGLDGAEEVLGTTLVGAAILLGICLVAALTSLFVRLRRARGDERQQLRWFVYAMAVAGLGILSGVLTSAWSDALSTAFWYVAGFGLMAMPVAAGVAILRYRLYDIDVVINKTVVFGMLAAFVTAVYVGIVVGIGALVGSRGNLLLSIIATALIAVFFQPIRVRARHLANRLVYGKRATPYEVLSEFADRVGGSYAAEDVLPRMARTIGEGTAASAGVWLRVGRELRLGARWPDDGSRPLVALEGDDLPLVPDADRAYPVRHHGDLLGALAVRKPPGEPLSPAEDALLEGLASQAGLILRNVRLIEELRASRQRLVAAQDEERRRLERNIHDGAQQQLVALTVKLRLLGAVAEKDGAKAKDLADQLRGETQDALENLRDLARGIYPPLLADKGLAAALESQARKASVPVAVEPNGVGRYPAEVEATAYFCVLEALQNVTKYADAAEAVVTLREEDGILRFEVQDDGRGFDATTVRGTGLQNMEDRVDALGGSLEIRSQVGKGTTIVGRIPFAGTEERT